jgi:hypothetical protein
VVPFTTIVTIALTTTLVVLPNAPNVGVGAGIVGESSRRSLSW